MKDRRLNIHKAHEGTCRWVLSLPRYIEWDSKPRGLLWIKGKPGAGKSTVMSFLYSIIGEKLVMEDTTYLEFFFNARGEALQHTFLGMLRSLLNQVYSQDPRGRALLRDLYLQKQASFGGITRTWQWQQEELKTLLEQIIIESASYRKIFLFIDALDEAGEHTAVMIAEYFHTINARIEARSGFAKIYLSCRHYPITGGPKVTEICVEDHNHDDIQAYIEAQLHRVCTSSSSLLNQQQSQDIASDLLMQAKGVFQWVNLVLPIVMQSIRNGLSAAQTLRRLRNAPPELSQVYEHILTNVLDRQSIKQSYSLFQWICLAERPLSLKEIRYALAANDVLPSSDSSLGITCSETDDFIPSDRIMKTQLRALSGGLLEDANNSVQVIHQTVRDFLVENGLALLESMTTQIERPTTISKLTTISAELFDVLQKSHAQLYWSCLKYLATEEVDITTPARRLQSEEQERLSESAPLIEYATLYVFSHAKKSGNCHRATLSEQVRLIDKTLRLWEYFNCEIIWSSEFFRLTESIHMLHIASAFGLDDLVRYVLKTDMDVNRRASHRLCTPLHFAAWFNHGSSLSLLLAAGSDVDAVNTRNQSSLMLAAMLGHKGIVQLLLANGALVDIQAQSGQTALIYASTKGFTQIVQSLLERHADVNVRQKNGNTSLLHAAKGGFEHVMQLLLASEAEVDAADSHGDTALMWSARHDHAQAVLLLLEHGAEVNIQNHSHETALICAVRKAVMPVPTRIVSTSNDIHVGEHSNRAGEDFSTEIGQTKTIQLLLAHEPHVNVQDHRGRSALMYAIYNGREDVVDILVEHSPEVSIKDITGRTPLIVAVTKRWEKVVKILLERQVDVNEVDHEGQTALMWAVMYGWKDAVVMLLEHEADATIQDEDGDTAFSYARRRNFIEIEELLLASQADLLEAEL